MADTMEYKCPSCGGSMEFDSNTQKLKCPFCATEVGIDEWEDVQEEQAGMQQRDTCWEAMGGDSSWTREETANMDVYSCQSCGGEIVAEKTTGATACPYCGNQVVIKGTFSGDLKPDYIIPFKLDKKAAKAAYKKHLTKKKFLPGIFAKENHIDEIKGMYVPFWLFDTKVHADVNYEAEKVKVWTSGDTEYTERATYDLGRSGSLSFEHLPVDCSRKMDDKLMESIEPYQFQDAVPFKAAYLSGYMADRYDVEMTEGRKRAEERIKRSAEEALKPGISKYDSVVTMSSDVHIIDARYWYVLYPVWILNTTWQKNQYIFAMNGQTGKMVGDLPFDRGAFWKYVASRGVAIGAVLYALMWMIIYMV